jgi:NAD-dependent SIR2 family protein deacetylase
VYPAAGFTSIAKKQKAVVAEVNLEETPATSECDFFFQGKAGEILPQLLKI